MAVTPNMTIRITVPPRNCGHTNKRSKQDEADRKVVSQRPQCAVPDVMQGLAGKPGCGCVSDPQELRLHCQATQGDACTLPPHLLQDGEEGPHAQQPQQFEHPQHPQHTNDTQDAGDLELPTAPRAHTGLSQAAARRKSQGAGQGPWKTAGFLAHVLMFHAVQPSKQADTTQAVAWICLMHQPTLSSLSSP